MNTLIISFSFLLGFGHDFKQDLCQLDVTELITNAMICMRNMDFDKDFTGQPYHPEKPWKVYNRFIDKQSYRDFLRSQNTGLAIVDSTCNLILIQNDSIGLTITNDLNAVLPFNHVEIQTPYFDFKENAFSTVIWVKDQSWMGGFCVLTRFKIENGVCKFLKGSAFVMSDVAY